MPMPYRRPQRDPVTAVFLCLARINGNGAALRKLVGVAHEIEQRLPQPHLIAMQPPDRSIATDCDLVGILRRQRLDGLDHIVDQRSEREIFELQLHPSSLDLGQVEDVIYEGE